MPVSWFDQFEQHERFRRFARTVAWCSLIGGLAYLGAGAGVGSLRLVLEGGLTLAICLAAVVGLHLEGQGRTSAGALVLGSVLLLVGPPGSLLLPFLSSSLAVTPVLAAAAVLPYLRGRAMRGFLLASLASSLLVTALGIVAQEAPALPYHAAEVLRAATLGAACYLALVLFGRYGARLKEALDRTQAILTSLEEGLVAQDAGGRVLLVNDAAERILGLEAQSLRDRPFLGPGFQAHRLDGTALPEAIQPRQVVLQTGQPLLNQCIGLWRPDGQPLWLNLSAYPLGRGPGETPAVLYSFTDATRRVLADQERAQLLAREQQARAEAEAASRAKDEFLATVSHELRTPLTALLGWARLVRSGKLPPGQLDHGLEVIERNALTQAQLVEDILDVSRIITGKLRLDLRSTDLGALVESAAEALRPAAEARALRLEFDLGQGPPMVADPVRLHQVVWNLLSNAIKFTPKSGWVQVRLVRTEAGAQLEVSDSGQGIDPSFLPHVFERFRQEDSRASRTHGGLGLGLAIVRHLVELHGGSVRAESAGLGQGARFVVDLPAVAATSALPPAVRPAKVTPGGSRPAPRLDGVRVLVVEDQDDSREVMSSALERYGATVQSVPSAAAALDAVERQPPHVILSDVAMPEEDGYRLMQKLRGRGCRIPAVAVTALAAPPDRRAALEAGFDEHLAKPLDPQVLAGVVARLLAQAEPRASPGVVH